MTVATDEKKGSKESASKVSELRDITACDIDSLSRAAKNHGDSDALQLLSEYGRCYCYGLRGLPQDNKKAFKCFKFAADAGDLESIKNLGVCYFRGVGVDVDLAKAKKLFIHVIDMGKNNDTESVADAMNMLARCYKKAGDEKNAFDYYEQAAHKGNGYAQAFLGKCYEIGGVGCVRVKKDEKLAAQYFFMAADHHNNALGKIGYACCLLNGTGGVEINVEKALELLDDVLSGAKKSSAEYLEAGVLLTYCYENGINLGQETAEDQRKLAREKVKELYVKVTKMHSEHAINRFKQDLKKISLGECLQECSICTSNFTADRGVITPCKHRFHRNCISSWLDDHATCPDCRRAGLTTQQLCDC
jgi:TPR repeat protein